MVARRPLHSSDAAELFILTRDTHLKDRETNINSVQSKENLSEIEITEIYDRHFVITSDGTLAVRDVNSRSSGFSMKASEESDFLEAHERVAKDCLQLLALRSVDIVGIQCMQSNISFGRKEKASLLTEYAIANWASHYRIAESYSRSLAGTLYRSLAIRFLHEGSSSFRSQQPAQVVRAILQICARDGFPVLAQKCLQMGMDPKKPHCHQCETPLELALRNGHVGMVQTFEKGARNKMTMHPRQDIGLSARTTTPLSDEESQI
ncbi:hypothetical protein MMC21_004263 [Puttea exsequens]|nr:hypothetical protein [Puttea exsequens]